jgi:hypothetical protein
MLLRCMIGIKHPDSPQDAIYISMFSQNRELGCENKKDSAIFKEI